MSVIVIGLLSGAAYALLAVGFVLIYRGTRVFNLAHGEIGALGLYAAWAISSHVPVLVAVLAGVAVAALTGVAIERTLVRRLVEATPLAAVATTLGAGLTLAYLEARIWGLNIKTFPAPFGSGSVRIGSETVSVTRLGALVAAAAVAAGLAIFLRRTRFGLEVSAATSDPALARLSGVPVARTRAFVWALGGALSGIAAILVAAASTFHPLSTTLVMVRGLAAALLGGLTSVSGAFVGGVAVGLTESAVISSTTLAGAADGAIFALLLGSLLLRPNGIMGARDA